MALNRPRPLPLPFPAAALRPEVDVIWLALIVMVLGREPAPAPAASDVRIGFVGDVSFGGRSDRADAIFAGVSEFLQAPDVMVANVEGLLLTGGAPAYGEARLDISASPTYAKAFVDSGFDLLGSANNHAWDAGARGVLEHLGHLGALRIPIIGSGPTADGALAAHRFDTAAGCVSIVPATLKSNRRPEPGAFVAFYGAGDKGARPLAELLARIAAERTAGCAPIVTIHWGREGKPLPDASVIAVGHALVEAGAALVVGHHPHVLQGVEWHAGPHGAVPIAWSLGNFVFKNRDPDKRRTGLLEVDLSRAGGVAGVREVALRPLTIDVRTFLPRRATEAEAREHERVMAKRSAPFGTTVKVDGGRLVFTRP